MTVSPLKILRFQILYMLAKFFLTLPEATNLRLSSIRYLGRELISSVYSLAGLVFCCGVNLAGSRYHERASGRCLMSKSREILMKWTAPAQNITRQLDGRISARTGVPAETCVILHWTLMFSFLPFFLAPTTPKLNSCVFRFIYVKLQRRQEQLKSTY